MEIFVLLHHIENNGTSMVMHKMRKQLEKEDQLTDFRLPILLPRSYALNMRDNYVIDLVREKHIGANSIKLMENEIHKQMNEMRQDIKQIKHLYNNIEVSQSNTCCIRFFINDNIKLQEFIKYANIKWKSYNVVLKQIEYDINSNTYINMNNLITDIAN
jgi:hypothetical protein